jgi:ribosomal protein S18 acetylase RimI-like enzyme
MPPGSILLMVEAENTAAQALYRRVGYRVVGTAADYYGRGRAGIWMQKGATADEPPRVRV